MFNFKKVFTVLLIGTLSGYLSIDVHADSYQQNSTVVNHSQLTSAFYESMLRKDHHNEALLHLFMNKMPKGGDIHHHFDGSIYAETFLEWVDKKDWKIDTCTLEIVQEEKDATCKLLTAEELIANHTLYRKLLALWSNKDYRNHYHHQAAPDSHFFNTFAFFMSVSSQYIHLGLDIVKQRALKENVSYIETILSRVNIESSNYFDNHSSIQYSRQRTFSTSNTGRFFTGNPTESYPYWHTEPVISSS